MTGKKREPVSQVNDFLRLMIFKLTIMKNSIIKKAAKSSFYIVIIFIIMLL